MREWTWHEGDIDAGELLPGFHVSVDGKIVAHCYDRETADAVVDALNAAERAQEQPETPEERAALAAFGKGEIVSAYAQRMGKAFYHELLDSERRGDL